MDKEELRKAMRNSRLNMPKSIVAEKSELINARLIKELDWSKLQSLHCYIPMSRLNEVDIWPLLRLVWQRYPRVLTAVPKAMQESKHQAIPVSPATKWHGLQPISSESLPDGYQFDAIIVPTLAFDRENFRLGWGGGFYDRFLSTQPDAKKIGVCFDLGRIDKIPAEAHDIALDLIITESS